MVRVYLLKEVWSLWAGALGSGAQKVVEPKTIDASERYMAGVQKGTAAPSDCTVNE
jgi:hypothetical protein